MIARILVLFILLVFPCSAFSSSYKPWSENVFQFVQKTYGEQAEKRFRYLHNLILKNQNIDDLEKLKLVNSTLNHLPWIADQQHWKNSDYWAAPIETIATFGGDCEDIAIAKFILLRPLGIAADNMRLSYVKIKKTGEAHMVLIYLTNPSKAIDKQQVYVLDNYVDAVSLAGQRKDLLAIYAFAANGDLVLFSDNGKERTVKGEYKERKLKKLDDLRDKMKKYNAKFVELNDGHDPLKN